MFCYLHDLFIINSAEVRTKDGAWRLRWTSPAWREREKERGIFVINYLIKRTCYEPSQDRNKNFDVCFIFLRRIEQKIHGDNETGSV